MLEDLEKLQQEGASAEEMQRRISATTTKLSQHKEDIYRKIARHRLEQRKEHFQIMLDTVRGFQDNLNSMEKSVSTIVPSVLGGRQVANICQTEGSGDEWEKVEKA